MAKSSNNGLKVALAAIGAVIVLVIVLVLVQSPTTTNTNVSYTNAASSVVKTITSIPNSEYDQVGSGTSNNLPHPITAKALTNNNKPELLYIGAEYCPYCATERWAMVAALSRFGTFSNLKFTTSSSTDVYPSTNTFSFYGSSYTSQYLTFVPVEQYSNQHQGAGYSILQALTNQQQSLFNTYDSPPYVSSSIQGSIPFIDFGGKYLIVGATYSPQVLQNLSWQQIASKLSNPNDPVTKGVLGSANLISATICKITNNQPANVCNTSGVNTIESSL